jgi:hypothetical protein
MATDRPNRPRLKTSILSWRVRRLAPSTAPTAEPMTSRIGGHGQDASQAEAAYATRVPIDSELTVGNGPGTTHEKTSQAVAAINASLDDLWVFSIPTRIVHRLIPGGWLIGLILTGAWPLILNGILTLTYPHMAVHSGAAWAWLTTFAATMTSALLAARVLWGRLIRDMPLIVSMFPTQEADHKLAAWIRSWFATSFQVLCGLVPSALAAFMLRLASPIVAQHLELSPVSYISVAWAGFITGLILYVFIMVSLMIFVIQHCGPLILDPWDPANTPGLKTLSRGYVYCLIVLIVFAAILEIAATKIPDYQTTLVLEAFVVGFPIVAVVCGLVVAFLPHLAIYNMTYAGKMRTTAIIDESIGDVKTSMSHDHGRLATLVWLRNQLSAAPGLPIRVPWLLPLVAALLGPLVAFLLTLKR